MNRREVVAAFASLVSERFLRSSQTPESEGKSSSLSLIRLIANPRAFDGGRLGLIGYLANNGIDRALGLYVSEVDGRNFIVSNSVDLRIEESAVKDLINKYVTLAASYHAPRGTPSSYNGYLDRISGLKAWGAGDAGLNRGS